MNEHPDAYLSEIAAHFGATESGVWRALSRLKITRKKKTTLYAEQDEVKRQIFLAELKKHPEARCVYIDESGIDAFVSREYGWGKRGQCVLGDVSGKRYARESFIAGMTQDVTFSSFLLILLILILLKNFGLI